MALRSKSARGGKTPTYDIKKIKEKIITGEQYKTIAEEIGCHETRVSQIALGMGIKRRRQPVSNKEIGYDIKTYSNILQVVSEERLNITRIACRLNQDIHNTGIKIQVLEKRGLIKKVLSGRSKIIVLTEAGERLIQGAEV